MNIRKRNKMQMKKSEYTYIIIMVHGPFQFRPKNFFVRFLMLIPNLAVIFSRHYFLSYI